MSSSSPRSLEELDCIDRGLQVAFWALFATIAAYAFAMTRTSSSLSWGLYAVTVVFQIFAVYRLSRALNSPMAMLVGRCLLCLVPTISLIVLVAAMSDARQVLSRKI